MTGKVILKRNTTLKEIPADVIYLLRPQLICSRVLHNDMSLRTDGLNTQWWPCKISMELKNFYCLISSRTEKEARENKTEEKEEPSRI
jgi:hypothetical protein